MNQPNIARPLGLRAVLIREYVIEGWFRRRRDGRREEIGGWRLALHRVLWGFHRLTYVEPGPATWTPFRRDGCVDRNRLNREGWQLIGAISGER